MHRCFTLILSLLATACQTATTVDYYRAGDEMEEATRHKRVSRTFEDFIASPNYRNSRDYWRGGAIEQYNPARSYVEILRQEQRGRLYINGTIAMDFPVSTGREGGHETPAGTFRITEKKLEHRSNLYGSFVDARGNTVKTKVRSSESAPAGSRFEGTPLPYWMRFNGAIGIHTGAIPREGVSHGCVRVPEQACSILFEKLAVGSQVIVK
ncbi:MAG: L,D-transpeptidase [Akkermansia sp.]|nr:L,D-transpeptidase [Akkermansia sp.]